MEIESIPGWGGVKKVPTEITANILNSTEAKKITDQLFGENTYDNLPTFSCGIFCYELFHLYELFVDVTDNDIPLKRINFQIGSIYCLDKYVMRHIFANRLHVFNQLFRKIEFRTPYPEEMQKNKIFINSLNMKFSKSNEYYSGIVLASSHGLNTDNVLKFFVIGIKDSRNIPVGLGILPYQR